MPCIAVVDDSTEMRGTVCRLIAQQLKVMKKSESWDVIDSDPLPAITDYDNWIQENEVSVLVLDERLDEKFQGEAVDYAGHQVARHLRERFRDLPQFIVTSIDNPEDLVKNGGDLEAILSRSAFNRSAAVYVQRMVRLGQTFFEEHEESLAKLSELSEKAARATLSLEEEASLRALRQSILVTSSPAGLDEVLDKADEILSELRGVADALRNAR